MMLTNAEKDTLKAVFNKMLEEGRTHFTAETAEIFGFGELEPRVRRKRFVISIMEQEMVEYRVGV